MGAGERIATVLAATAWTRLAAAAQEALPEPQCKSLLADPERTVQEKRSRQHIATNGVVEARAKGGMAVKR